MRELDITFPVVMGILNLTPDSFYDGGKYDSVNSIIEKVEQMLKEGASVIDIGALSTKPGAKNLTATEELDRLIPHLKTLRKTFSDTIISIDTFRKEVAAMAIEEGADIINDISGGKLDDEMIPYMTSQEAAYILMHMQGTPETMQVNPVYDDVVLEVTGFFKDQLTPFEKAGKKNIILDPGFGFGKTVDHNYKLLGSLDKFIQLGYPVLAGVSRKSMINKVLLTTPASALNGTTVVNTIALLQGASILRVHDVKAAIEAIKLTNQFRLSSLNS